MLFGALGIELDHERAVPNPPKLANPPLQHPARQQGSTISCYSFQVSRLDGCGDLLCLGRVPGHEGERQRQLTTFGFGVVDGQRGLVPGLSHKSSSQGISEIGEEHVGLWRGWSERAKVF